MTTAEVPQVYCVKAKVRTDNDPVERVAIKNGRSALKTTCVDCGTGKFRIGR